MKPEPQVKNFILASGSPQRRALLAQMGFLPKQISPADIDESEKKYETATAYVKRMALEKARRVAGLFPHENILACDTVVVVGASVLHKAQSEEEQTVVMERLSGKAHRVISSVCVISDKGQIAQRTVTTRILMKKLTPEEIRAYVATHNWEGACGYKIEDMEAYVKKMVGSYSGVIGLPLYETRNLLNGIGIK